MIGNTSGARVAVTVTDLVTGSCPTKVCHCPNVGREYPFTLKQNAWREVEAAEVKAREGATDTRISSKAIVRRGLLVCWAIVDREWVRMGLRLKEEAQDLR